MSTTVARIDAILDVDGSRVPRQVKQLGEKAGRDAANSFGDEFDDTMESRLSDWGNVRLDVMRERFRKAGVESGRIFGLTLRQSSDASIAAWVDDLVRDIDRVFTFADSDGWDRWVENAGSVGEAYRKMSDNITIATREGRLQESTADALQAKLRTLAIRSQEAAEAQERLALRTESVNRYMQRIDDTLTSSSAFRRHVNEVGDLDVAYERLWRRIQEIESAGGDQRWADKAKIKLMDLSEALDKSAHSANNADKSYRNLPHGLRQAIFWVTLVTAALPDLAVLGSAAGAGLMVLGNAAFALVAGLGVGIAAFKDLSKDLDELPESSHAAKRAFDEMTDAFGRLQDRISERVLGQVAPVFERITGLVDRLGPAFDVVSDAVAGAADEFSKIISSEKGFKAIDGALRGAAPIFEAIASSAATLSVALLQAFANPEVQRSTQELIGWIDELIAAFDEFTQNGGLDEWMQNARTIFGELGELLDRTGQLLNDLVNEDTVANTADFLDSMTGVMDLVQSLLDLVSAANPFGLLAQGLETVGNVLTPVLSAFTPLVEAVSTVIQFFMELTEVFWTALYPIFLPLELGWKAVNSAVEAFMEWVEPVLTALQDMGDEIKALGDDIWTELEPALEDLWTAFLDLLPSPEELARIIREDVIPMVERFANWITTKAIPAIKRFIEWIEDVVDSLGGWDGISNKLAAVGAAFSAFGTIVAFALGPVIALINGIIASVQWLQSVLPGVSAQGARIRGGGGTPPRALASGAVVSRPEYALIGEAGTELVVPIDQPLSQVDPAVRDVAAYARGEGGARGGNTFDVTIYEAGDARRTAFEVFDVIAEKLTS